jgi:hypothetical protein
MKQQHTLFLGFVDAKVSRAQLLEVCDGPFASVGC